MTAADGVVHSQLETIPHGDKEKMKYQQLTLVAMTTAGLVQALPKYETTDKGLLQSKRDYFQASGDQVAMESEAGLNITARLEEEGQDRPPRFGFPTYTQDVQTVNNVAPGLYGPVKLDIGGLVLGTIVGLGAFFILPKLFHVVATPYGGGYKRSEDEGANNSLGHLLTRIQDGLNAYDIDSAACLQRAVCASVQSAGEKTSNKTANTLETAVDSIAKNDVMKTLIEGTEWKKAVDAGARGDDCSSAFPKCPTEVDAVASAIAKYLMS